MTYTFAAAQGGKVGGSICGPDMFPVALEILELAKKKGVQLVMSPDALIADAFSAGRQHQGGAGQRHSRRMGRVWTSARRQKGL